MIAHGKEIKVFTGNSNPELAKAICSELFMGLGNSAVSQFADGECSISVYEPVRGKDVFIVQSTCKPVNDSLMELLIMIDAMRRASAGRITAVIPYFGYARQDRKAKSRDPISAKLVANLITAAGADRVLTMDLHAAQIQGFTWETREYSITDPNTGEKTGTISVIPTREQYKVLLERYKELRKEPSGDGGGSDPTFAIDPYLTELSTGLIDSQYLNSRFEKYKKILTQPDVDPAEKEATLEQLHKAFASLSQEEQRYANLFLHDVEAGDVRLEPDCTFMDYIHQYASAERERQVKKVTKYFGIPEDVVCQMLDAHVNEQNYNDYGRFDNVKKYIVKEDACAYITALEGKRMPPFRVNNRSETILKEFFLSDGKKLPDAPKLDQ